MTNKAGDEKTYQLELFEVFRTELETRQDSPAFLTRPVFSWDSFII